MEEYQPTDIPRSKEAYLVGLFTVSTVVRPML